MNDYSTFKFDGKSKMKTHLIESKDLYMQWAPSDFTVGDKYLIAISELHYDYGCTFYISKRRDVNWKKQVDEDGWDIREMAGEYAGARLYEVDIKEVTFLGVYCNIIKQYNIPHFI